MKVIKSKVRFLSDKNVTTWVDGFDLPDTCFTLIPWTHTDTRSIAQTVITRSVLHYVPTMRSNGGKACEPILTRTAAVAWCKWIWGRLPDHTKLVFSNGDQQGVLDHCKGRPYVQRLMRYGRLTLCYMKAKEIEKAELPDTVEVLRIR